MTLRYIVDGEVQQDSIEVLWTTPTEDGHVSLMSHPELNYVIARHNDELTEGLAVDYEAFAYNLEYVSLGRPEAGQLALALTTAVITNSDQIINSYIAERMARR
jgi:hypothetical protein